MSLLLRFGGALVGLALLFGAANAAGFEMRARALQQTWQRDEAAGVSADRLAEAKGQAQAIRSRRLGPLPYEVISGGAVIDPLAPAEASTRAALSSATVEAHQQAQAALDRLRAIGGPNYEVEYEDHLTRQSSARTPAQQAALARQWGEEAQQLQGQRDGLAAAAGGLTADGMPQDVTTMGVRLLALEATAEQSRLWTDPAFSAIAEEQMYMREPYPRMLADHDRIAGELGTAVAALQGRLDAWTGAEQTLSRVQSLLPTANRYGAGSNLGPRLQQVQQALASARDDQGLSAAAQAGNALLADARRAVSGLLPVDSGACIQDAPSNLIVIHLATQQMVAYENGCPWMRTPVTTGRSALPTDRGTFHIFYKAPVFKMVSEWPQPSPFWYPTTYVNWAMEFVGDGTFIHSADWEPASAYGQNSEYGPYASHGCIHVLDGPLQQLYAWAPIGTTVVTED